MNLSDSLKKRVEQGDRSHELLLALHEAFMGEGNSRDDGISLVADALIESGVDLDEVASLADELAIDVEKTAGLGIPIVDEDGLSLSRTWPVYAPVDGRIARTGNKDDVVDGAVFLDLVSPSIVAVRVKDGRARIVQGTVDLSELDEAKDPWDRFASACQHRIESANDDSRTEVSSFTVAIATTGILGLFEKFGEGALLLDIERVIPQNGESLTIGDLWDELNQLGVGIRGRRGRCA